MKIKLIIEKGDKKDLWGRIEGHQWMPTTIGQSLAEIKSNLKDLFTDYVEHEGASDKKLNKYSAKDLEFDIFYDLQSFFAAHNCLNISEIAKLAGMNPGLLRQYVAGVKHPSKDQATKILQTVKKLAKELSKVELV